VTRIARLALTLGALAAASGLSGQQADLTGTWVAVKDAPATAAVAPSAILGAKVALRQTATTLTVARTLRDSSVEATFEIGGPDVRVRVPGALCMGDAYFIEAVAREGSALAFTMTGNVPAGGTPVAKVNIRRLLRLESPDTLVVEATIVQGGQPKPVGTVYRRSTDPMPPPAPALPATKAAATIADTAWIGGLWQSEGATTTEERWTPPAGGAMLAVARTLRGPAMSAFEFLCIAERDGSLVYSAMPNGRSPATDFVLTGLTPDSATFENPAHDYPKTIRYTRRPDGTLETVVSGAPGQRVVTTVLKKP